MSLPFEKFFRRRRDLEISLSEEDGVRYLHFGSVWIQGAMRIADPFKLELEYTRELFAGLLFNPTPKNVTLLGLGAGSATKFAWKQYPRARITSVEIDAAVIACAHRYFELPPDSRRMRTVCANGEAWLEAQPAASDYLIVDVYDAAARGPVLSSPEFYASCRAAMAVDANSVMAVNLFGKHESFQRSIRNIERAFDGRMLVLPASGRGNVIAFGFTGDAIDLPLAELRSRATQLKAASGLTFPKYLTGFRQANPQEGSRLAV